MVVIDKAPGSGFFDLFVAGPPDSHTAIPLFCTCQMQQATAVWNTSSTQLARHKKDER